MPVERKRLVNFAVSEDERAKLEALSDQEALTASALLRRWIRQRYEAVFGDAPPPKRPARR